ncbi:MAG: tRNA-dihydrouridine synthase family protein [Spirochaetaceae bacterium]|jgi:tRNA-dihydrouridine synthase|nr:tRNA-dihydrouridine synthase family protein [Spirochaetaceae bacterium]
MAEISHRALRELIESFGGVDEYFSEMLAAGAVTQNGIFESYYLDAGPVPEKFVYQICGVNKEQLACAASFLDKKQCKGIDINMGCSAPAIVRTGAGAAWLSDIEKSAEMMRAVRRATKKRLSVKMRIGERDDFEYLVRFCTMLENEGVEFITLHPRTTKEKFKRRARWNYIDELQKILGIPLAGNGDISSAESLYNYAISGKYHALMIGRFAVKSPWVFAQVKNMPQNNKIQNSAASELCPDLATKIDLEGIACYFLDLLTRYQPQEFFLSRSRRFFTFFSTNFKWGEYLKNLLFRETTMQGMRSVLHSYFNEHPQEKFLSPVNFTGSAGHPAPAES